MLYIVCVCVCQRMLARHSFRPIVFAHYRPFVRAFGPRTMDIAIYCIYNARWVASHHVGGFMYCQSWYFEYMYIERPCRGWWAPNICRDDRNSREIWICIISQNAAARRSTIIRAIFNRVLWLLLSSSSSPYICIPKNVFIAHIIRLASFEKCRTRNDIAGSICTKQMYSNARNPTRGKVKGIFMWRINRETEN